MSNWIPKLIELMSVKYTSLLEDISQHVDYLAGLVEQLQGIGTKIADLRFPFPAFWFPQYKFLVSSLSPW